MKYEDFENRIRKEFNNAEEPVAMDSLLTSLNLDTKKKPKTSLGGFIKILLPILIIGGVFANKMVQNNDYNDKLTHTVQVENNNQLQNNLEVNKSLESDQTASKYLAPAHDKSNNSTQSKKETEAEFNSDVIHTQTDGLNKEEIVRSSSSITKRAKNTKHKNTNQHSKDNTTTNNNKDIAEKSTQKSSTQEKSTYDLLVSSYTHNELKPNAANENVNASASASANVSASANANANASVSVNNQNELLKLNSESLAFKHSPDTKHSIPAITTAKIERRDFESVSTLLNNDGLFSRMKINCPSFAKSNWHIGLMPEVGAFYPIKSLSYKSLEVTEEFLNRQSNENSLEGLNIGLHAMAVKDDLPIYIKAGISYSRITEKASYESVTTTYDTIYGIIGTTVSPSGDTISYIKGDIPIRTDISRTKTKHYKIHQINFPISVGYTTYIGGIDIGFEGGVVVNLLTRAQGNILVSNEFDNPIFDDVSTLNMFKKRVGLSYFGGIMIGRSFESFGDVFIAPRFTYHPGNYVNDSHNINQNYFRIGLNAGMIYRL